MIDFSTKNRNSPTPDGISEIPDPRWNLGPKIPKSPKSIEVAGCRRHPGAKRHQATSIENDQKGPFWPKSDRGSLVTF